MSTPIDRSELSEVIKLVAKEAERYLESLDTLPVRRQNADEAAHSFTTTLSEEGVGAAIALRELIDQGLDGVINSAGPRFFHWVIGGTTPAALGADWIASTLDQLTSDWTCSPLAVQLEIISLSWLRELFGLSDEMTGVMTTGAMMANFTGLAAARQWCGEQAGIDVSEEGLSAIPPIPVFSSGYLHVTSSKAISMLGIGRRAITRFSKNEVGSLDVDALEDALRKRDGAPSIVIANAGEVNAGHFDPIDTMADLAKKYNAWLHVDGAFGLFARLTPRAAHLAAGVERADSVTVDGHKWLNVPYDCGFSFVRDTRLLAKVFAMVADYLPDPDNPKPNYSFICPESSRRARSLAVWATLRAYGRQKYQQLVEHHLDLAQYLAKRVDESPNLERLADVPLNIVCFRVNPAPRKLTEEQLDTLNETLGEKILEDGRVFVGTTKYGGKTALRPAIVNWRTERADIDLLVEVVEKLGREISVKK